MYSAQLYKKTKAVERLEESKVKPLRDTNPRKAAKIMNKMCDNSKARR